MKPLWERHTQNNNFLWHSTNSKQSPSMRTHCFLRRTWYELWISSKLGICLSNMLFMQPKECTSTRPTVMCVMRSRQRTSQDLSCPYVPRWSAMDNPTRITRRGLSTVWDRCSGRITPIIDLFILMMDSLKKLLRKSKRYLGPPIWVNNNLYFWRIRRISSLSSMLSMRRLNFVKKMNFKLLSKAITNCWDPLSLHFSISWKHMCPPPGCCTPGSKQTPINLVLLGDFLQVELTVLLKEESKIWSTWPLWPPGMSNLLGVSPLNTYKLQKVNGFRLCPLWLCSMLWQNCQLSATSNTLQR